MSSASQAEPLAQERERPLPTAMVVEDEAILAMSLEDGLSDKGFRVVGPFSACAAALAALETSTLISPFSTPF